MNKKIFINILIGMWVTTFFATNIYAFEIPGYITDPQDVKANVDAIVKKNAPDATSSTTASATERQSAIQLNQYIASLYGKAIATRAEYIDSEKASSAGVGIDAGEISDIVGEASELAGNDKLEKAVSTGANILEKVAKKAKFIDSAFENMAAGDKNQSLQQNVKESLRRNAIIINKVVALEAEIVNLEALLRLRSAISGQSYNSEDEE